MRASRAIVSLAFAASCLTACVSRSDFTAISGKNVNLSDVRIDRSKTKGRVQGKDCTYIVVIIPTGGPPTLDEALDRALESAQANVLLDAVVTYRTFYIPYLFGETCWEAEGDAYDTYQ